MNKNINILPRLFWAGIIGIRKVLRFSQIYGSHRAVVKLCGRLRLPISFPFSFRGNRQKTLAMFGCGQFPFSTLAYFVKKDTKYGFKVCYDPDRRSAGSFARFYGVPVIAQKAEDAMDMDGLKGVFIASNHASHTQYAIMALNRGLDVHLEKPICVSRRQFVQLLKAQRNSKSLLVAGYNRPYSGAIKIIDEYIKDCDLPISLNCHICGHMIPKDHWYRNPEEGTRICGNVGHWLDLAIHCLNIRGRIPASLDVSICYADKETEPDDNIVICLSSEFGDLISIFLTSRCEPFEGIQETINLQCGTVMTKVDDFRKVEIWKDDLYTTKTFRPKDVGHERSATQLFGRELRDWREVELSTILMLFVKDMVLDCRERAILNLLEEHMELCKEVEAEGPQ